jgi:sugar diacid utilization regulator
MGTTPVLPDAEPPEAWGREPLSRLYSLFALSTAMFDGHDEDDVLRMAMAAVGRLGPCRAEAGYVLEAGTLVTAPTGEPRTSEAVDHQVRGLGSRDGAVLVPERGWGWAFALVGHSGRIGYLVVSSMSEPAKDERFLIKVLAQQTAAALDIAAARRDERQHALELRKVNEDRAAKNAQLTALVSLLARQRSVHEVLSRASASGEGEEGIARAVHGLTGLPVAVEDRFGNLRTWSGPGRPDPYEKPEPAAREQLLQRVGRDYRPVRVRDRLVALARHRGQILGVMALVDPDDTAGEYERYVLDNACTAVTLELAHRRNLAEVELRLRRELVDDLITGTDDASAFTRSEAVGHDLHGPHYLAVAQWRGTSADDPFVRAVARAAGGMDLRILLARHSGMAVMAVRGRPKADMLYAAVARELGSRTGAIGVGGRCGTPGEFPRSYQEALRALEVRQRSRTPYGATAFDELGLYRILANGDDYRQVEEFVREWLGPLLDYDAAHRSDLVRTLSQYFECGGNYDETAAGLAIHRSTLRYRLQRIRDIGGLDLADVDSRLNLHVAARVWSVLGG